MLKNWLRGLRGRGNACLFAGPTAGLSNVRDGWREVEKRSILAVKNLSYNSAPPPHLKSKQSDIEGHFLRFEKRFLGSPGIRPSLCRHIVLHVLAKSTPSHKFFTK